MSFDDTVDSGGTTLDAKRGIGGGIISAPAPFGESSLVCLPKRAHCVACVGSVATGVGVGVAIGMSVEEPAGDLSSKVVAMLLQFKVASLE